MSAAVCAQEPAPTNVSHDLVYSIAPFRHPMALLLEARILLEVQGIYAALVGGSPLERAR